jgi:hypothetical protein
VVEHVVPPPLFPSATKKKIAKFFKREEVGIRKSNSDK